MSALTDARQVLADAVTGTGLQCAAYAPDALVAPGAWIDSLTIDYDTAGSFCVPGQVEAVVIAVGQRNDRARSAQLLDELQPDVVEALETVEGVRVTQVQSGTAEVNGQTLPAVLYTTQFHIT